MTDAPHLVGVPVAAETVARTLEQHPDYKVLRRMEPMLRGDPLDGSQTVVTGVVVDVETTGIDLGSCRVIELAAQRFGADEEGRILWTAAPRDWLEDPQEPLTDFISRLTRLTDADLTGHAIPEADAIAMIGGVDVVIAHNAPFDLGFITRRLPELKGLDWACSMRDFDWQAAGFAGRELSNLLLQTGWFYKAHRADADVCGVLHLLDHQLESGNTVLKELLDAARRPSWTIEAVGATFDTKGALKLRGYRWDPDKRVWWRDVRDDGLEAEKDWCNLHVYGGSGALPLILPVTMADRHTRRR